MYPGQPGNIAAYGEIAWSSDQMTRLENEWRRLQRAFAYHPHVTLTPLHGDPPFEYQVDYRVTTLVGDEYGNLQYAPGVSVHVQITGGFPHEPPVVRPLAGVFHPNVSYEGFWLGGLWQPNQTLEGLVRQIGDLLAYRTYDPNGVVNPAAAEWMAGNAQMLPLDRQADLSPNAGGDPLGRICRYGQQSIEHFRQSLLSLHDSLLQATAPSDAEAVAFANKTRLALNLFLENDVPDDLRHAASEIDDSARELPNALGSYAYCRKRRALTAACKQTGRSLLDMLKPVTATLDKLAGIVTEDPLEPLVALRLLPELAVLQPFQMQLPKQIQDLDQRIAAMHHQLKALVASTQPQVIPTDALLSQRLEKELDEADKAANIMASEVKKLLTQMEALAVRAKEDLAALEQIVLWRELQEMIGKGRGLERRIAEWGSEGVQAYFVENESGRFGPFQFEQPVDLGKEVLVRNMMRGSLEVRDPALEKSLGESKNGTVAVEFPAGDEAEEPAEGEKPKTYRTTFTITERCDDLLIQLDFLRRQVVDTFKGFHGVKITSQTWCGNLARLLATESSRMTIEKDLSVLTQRWKATCVDLANLSPFKERLTTYFVLSRAAEALPRLTQELAAARHAMKDSDVRMEEIVKRCSRDVETDRLVVPPKLAKRYEEEQALRKKSTATIERNTKLIKSLGPQVLTRLGHPKLLGRGTIPKMKALTQVPDQLAALPLPDGQLGELIVICEEALGRPLGGPRPEPRAEPVPEPVAEYAPAEGAEPEYAEGEEGVAYAEGEAAYVEGEQPAYAEGEQPYTEGEQVAYAEAQPVYEGEQGYAEVEATAEATPESAAEGEDTTAEVTPVSAGDSAAAPPDEAGTSGEVYVYEEEYVETQSDDDSVEGWQADDQPRGS